MVSEISCGLVVQDKKVLMVQNQDSQEWNFPSAQGRSDEISADTAERAVKKITGCETDVSRYRDRLKTIYDNGEKEVTWQPYSIEINGEPKDGEWVPIEKLKNLDLATPLEGIRSKLTDKL